MIKRIALLLFIMSAAQAALAAGFQVVAHPGVTVSTLSKQDASAIFMKKTTKWEDGTAVVAVDLTPQSPSRAAFTSLIHGKSVAAIQSYWRQLIFGGRDIPPVEKSSDAEVLAMVRSQPGAIGYVSDTATTAGVKVIQIR